jgi:plasmid stabilization system protein ParE
MSRYVLSPLAQRDLADIRGYYLEQGSPRAARQRLVELVEAFRSLARNPGIGHQREDLAGNRRVLSGPFAAT